ncbi:maleylpyruvate isomerase family mycothiol-dependent enzyme [Nocardia halotolerans]|uniref:Maleylpyruvate isomerase family mycothiol-dependent enzyme n=1 Tax=Nocardia halotolerans TaxID=1755878 RepID=A0ABV8VGN3_9NOCA
MPDSRTALWAMAQAERAALADDLADLTDEQWHRPSLCGSWTIEEVLAHLTAAASTGRVRWATSVLAARFDFDEHNDRRKADQLGRTPAETLARFTAIIPSTTAASGHTAAWLGEVVVHAQDIRRPLGLNSAPTVEAATAVAEFFAGRDFTVPSRTRTAGLCLAASDGPFTHGTGPLVSGTTIALTMAMAGRLDYCDDLSGPGVARLRDRITADAN